MDLERANEIAANPLDEALDLETLYEAARAFRNALVIPSRSQ